MNLLETTIPDVKLIEPKIFGDDRGFFYESFNARMLAKFGIEGSFVQDNHSRSARNVLRGLHYQIQQPQDKLVRVVVGEVYDVAVDIRRSSPTFGWWVGMYLSAQNKRMAWIPKGFAHGFLTLTEYSEFVYKTTDYYAPEFERSILWDDPAIGINWPISGAPQLAKKDLCGLKLADAETFL